MIPIDGYGSGSGGGYGGGYGIGYGDGHCYDAPTLVEVVHDPGE